jgi:hypothetical protein
VTVLYVRDGLPLMQEDYAKDGPEVFKKTGNKEIPQLKT